MPTSPLDFSGNPLVNDDRALPNPSPLDFSGSPAGLDLSRRSPSPMGLQGMPSLDFGALTTQMQNTLRAPTVAPTAQSSEAPIYFSPSTGEMVVNGFTFNQRNASQALVSEQFANQPRQQFTLPDTATDWREMPRSEYAAYLNTIKNPTFGRRMGEAWENAWRGVGDVAVGAGLAADRALTGDEDNQWLLGARANLTREFEENAPFMMQLRDIQDPGDALTYFSQMLVQGAPWLVETAVSMGVGALIGGAVSGGAGAPAGAIEAFTAKEALRAASRQLLRTNLARGARAYEAAQAARGTAQGAAALTREEVVRLSGANADDVNRFFNFAERAYHMSRSSVGGSGFAQAGAVAGMTASNYATGVGDIRNTIADAGGDPESADAVANIWGLAVPYAFVESMGDLLVTQPITHLLPGMANATARSAGLLDQLAARGTNAARYAGMTGAAEGLEEGAQYAITQQGVAGATNRPIDIEPLDLLESVVGGAIAGAGLGGVTGALGTPGRRPATSTAGTAPAAPIAGLTPQGPTTPEPIGGLDLNQDPNDTDPNYVGYAEQQAMRNNALSDPGSQPYTYDGEGDMGGLDLNQDPNDVDPNYVGQQEAQQMRTNAIQDIGPTTVTPPPVETPVVRTPEAIYADIAQGRRVAPQEFDTLRAAVRDLQRTNPTNPKLSEAIDFINDIEAEQNRQAPNYDWSRPKLDPIDQGLAPIDPNAPVGEYQQPEGYAPVGDELRGRMSDVPVGQAQPDDLMAPIRDHMGRTVGIASEMEPAYKNVTTVQDALPTWDQPIKRPRGAQRRNDDGKPVAGRKPKREPLSKDAQRAFNRMTEAAKKVAKKREEARAAAAEERAREEYVQGKAEEFTAAQQAKASEATPVEEPMEPNLNAIKAAAQRARKALDTGPRTEETQRNKNRDAKFPTQESDDLKEAASIKPKSGEGSQARIDKAKAALLEAAGKEKKDPKQKAANAALQLSKQRMPKQKWFYENGDALTHEELVTLIEQLKAEQPKVEKPKVSSKSKSAELFHSYVVDEWKNSKNPATGSKETFEQFVLENRIAIQDWIDTPLVSGRIAAARKAAQEILETTQKPKRATDGEKIGPRQVGERNTAPKNVGGRPPTVATAILRRVLRENPDFTFKPVHPATRARNLKVLDEINAAQRAAGEPETDVVKTSDYLSHLKKRMREENEKPKRATGERLPRRVIDVRTPDGMQKIIVNPTRDDVMKMTRTPLGKDSFKYDTVRFIKDDNGNVFVANGYFFIHDQIVDVVEDRGITVAGYESDLGNVQMGHGDDVVASSFTRKGDELVFSKFSSVTEETLWPKAGTKRSTGREHTQYKTVSESEVRKTVNKVQRQISEDVKFKSTHIMGNVMDIFERGNEEMMTAPNGAKASLMQYIMRQASLMKMENPELKGLTTEAVASFFVQEHMQAKAFVVPGYQALFVFADYMKNERDLVENLEHEYIVHAGLKAIFPDRIDREMFLTRFGKIPGVEQARKHLLAVKPEYENVTPLDQLEEVIAYHSMHGPLALERLLSAEEGIDQATRRTLWEDLKRMVAEWIAKIFGTDVNKTADVMDDVVAALRQHAIVGTNEGLMSIMDKHGAPRLTVAEREAFYAFAEEKVKRAVATATPADTQAKLYGTDTNPARPYKKVNYIDDTIEMLRANEPLIEKLSELQERGVAAPIKEGLKKVGRELVTMNDMALKSVLIEKMMRIMHNTIKYARNIMTRVQERRQYATKSAKTARIRALWGDKFPGSTPEQIEAYNRMAMIATNNRIATLSDAEVRNAPRLRVRNVNGTYTINMEVYKQMLERGTLSKEEYEKGVEQFTVDKKGETTSAGVAKLSKEMIDLGYEMYVNETKLMAESALKTLDAMNEALSMRNEHAIEEALLELEFEEKDQPFAREALQRMRKLYADIAFHNYSKEGREKRFDQKKMAHQVLVELMRAFHEELKVKDWTDSRATAKEGANPRSNDAFKWRNQVDPHKDVEPFVNQIRWFLEYDDAAGMNRMERINSLGVNKTQQYALMNAFQALINAETQALELENDVIQSIMGNYVEMTRKGEWRVALEVRDANGKEITNLSPELLAVLPVTYTETRREAIALQHELMEEFTGTHKVRSADGKDVIDVTFDVSMAMAPGIKTMGDAPKVREFLKVAELAGMTLKPHQMKVIANLIESAATRKRLGLQRAGTPGADINILQNNSETITRRAWQAAKTSQAWMLESTMTDRKNQYGDWDRLAMLQQNFDIANRGAPEGSAPPVTFVRSKAAVIVAEKELLRYAEQLRHMARHSLGRPTVNIRTTKGEQKLKITGEAEAFNVHAQALKASLEKGDIEVNLNDLISKTGALRQMAVVSQLGTIAAGIMNPFTLITHLPYRLTANHPKTGYGEGFEFSEVTTGIMQATAQVGNLFANLSDSAKIKKLLDDAKAGNNATNLTIAELDFIYKETLDGILMPQQTYSLTGGTESSITNLLTRNLMTMLLGPFSATEAATRRISALVTYRLAKARYIAAGVSEEKLNDPTSPEYKKLIEDIDAVVFDSQGDYSNINRPRSFRGDWAQYVFQYKMFPLNTVLLIKNLPRKEQAIMLGTIFLLAGLKGEPFADDFADIYDTLLQSLGFKHDSVELQLTRTLEEIMPGLSSWVMRGSIDRFIPVGATLSSRLSMGDILPLTGVFRPEADLGRELSNALGPAYAANMDAVEWAGTVADFALQAAGAKPRTTPWIELIRRFPQGQVRAFTEAGMMAESGEIVDPRGRLVSDEVTAMNMFSRALGFYPLEASQANNAVRLDRMHTGYMRAVRARFVLAYANAYRTGDEEAMDNILQSVRDWNDAVEQTGQEDMEIRNFRTAAVRAGRAASSTTIERTSQGAPDYSVIDEVAGILNADQESEE